MKCIQIINNIHFIIKQKYKFIGIYYVLHTCFCLSIIYYTYLKTISKFIIFIFIIYSFIVYKKYIDILQYKN